MEYVQVKTIKPDTAELSNEGRMVFFSFGGSRIRFLGAKCLRRFTGIRKWHDGFLVVEADNGGNVEEEYINLVPILKNLYIDPETYIKPIKKVELKYG